MKTYQETRAMLIAINASFEALPEEWQSRLYLEGANLYEANLEGANLEGANLKWANLEGANLEGANLVGIDREIGGALRRLNPLSPGAADSETLKG